MAVCFFNRIYDNNHKYICNYELSTDEIICTVDYDITDEVEPVNGVRAIGPNTEYTNRDILIVDYDHGISYLLKDAYYCGSSSVYGNPDGGSKTKFATNIYFYSNSYQDLFELKETPKIDRITIVSKDLMGYISDSSISRTESKEKLVIKLSKESNREIRHIGSNNIKVISLQDYWSGGFNKDHDIAFDITGHLIIKLSKRVNYTEIPAYVYELYVFLQIYTKRSLKIDEIRVSVNGTLYGMGFYIPSQKRYIRKNRGEKSVQCSIMNFLERCYVNIPYRHSKSDIRNIPYIILKRDRSLEDNFLMYYRFVECYYKKQDIPKIKTAFISHSLNENYVSRGKLLPSELENVTNEIVTLRNHYVHSGYYIRNDSLRIKFNDTEKNYTAKADIEWIYERTKILYEISIDIIFRDMLKYEQYTFC